MQEGSVDGLRGFQLVFLGDSPPMRKLTTKMIPNSLTKVHFRVFWSLLYGGFVAADCESLMAALEPFSSIKTSLMKLLIRSDLTGVNVLDQRTTPDVVRISKVSNMLSGWCSTTCEHRRTSLRANRCKGAMPFYGSFWPDVGDHLLPGSGDQRQIR
jgi:hypothetical protein